MNLETFKKELLETGESTFFPLTGKGKRKTGYMGPVSGYEKFVPLNEFSIDTVSEYISNRPGGWYKHQCVSGIIVDGGVFLLTLARIKNLEEACYVGIINNSHAIFDVTRDQEVFLPSPQKTGTETQKRDYNKVQANKVAQDYMNSLN